METSMGVAVQPALLTLEQAAEYLGASTVWAVRRLVSMGKLPYVKIGKRYNVRRAALDQFIQDRERLARKVA
jgi:excisionase family DNA binding protein